MLKDNKVSFDEFPKLSFIDWQQKAIHDLKGKTIDDVFYTSSDGIKISSYGCSENSKKCYKLPSVEWIITALTDFVQLDEFSGRKIKNIEELGKNLGDLSLENMHFTQETPVFFSFGYIVL